MSKTEYVINWTHGKLAYSQKVKEMWQANLKIREVIKSCPGKIWVEKIDRTPIYNITWGLDEKGYTIIHYK